jgi:AAA-like domain/TIR domain
MVRFFLSYSLDGQTESMVLEKALRTSAECEVFRYQNLPVGTRWPEEVELQLNICDCLVVLLSRHAVDSGNVFVEIQRSKAASKPILPIYIAVKPDEIPVSLDGLLHGINWTTWTKVELDLITFCRVAIQHGSDFRSRPASPKRSPGVIVSTGALPDEMLYTQRLADKVFEHLIEAGGTVVLLVGPLQAGKSSLLARAVRRAATRKCRWVDIDLGAQKKHLRDLNTLLRCLVSRIDRVVSSDPDPHRNVSIKRAVDGFPESIVGRMKQGDVICIDEANALLRRKYSADFVDLLKSWTSIVARTPAENRHTIVLSLSSEDYRRYMISSFSQSVPVDDFNEEEILDLAVRYGLLVTPDQARMLLRMTGGRPYLTSACLVLMKSGFAELNGDSRVNSSFEANVCQLTPVKEHLTSLYQMVQEGKTGSSLKRWLSDSRSPDYKTFGRLKQLGIMKGLTPTDATITCRVYDHYFRKYL